MMDSLTFPMAIVIAIAIAIVILLILVAVIVVMVRRSRMRRALGLPPDSRLGDRHKRMFRAFEDTDVRLSKKMPYLPKGQREALAREILREKGLLPKKPQNGR